MAQAETIHGEGSTVATRGASTVRETSVTCPTVAVTACEAWTPSCSTSTVCSPASRHGRRERVFTFSAYKERSVDVPRRHVALPDWLVTGKEPVPLSPSFRQQAMTTQIYSFIMSLIDGKRSIRDMAVVLEQQRLMTEEEAIPAIRTFLTKMYDDSQRRAGL